MSFDWQEYIILAERLLQPPQTNKFAPPNPEEEARYRASSSRAYYAAFNILVKYLEDFDDEYDLEKIPRGQGKHDYTIGRLKKIQDSVVGQGKLMQLAEKMYRAKDTRRKSDYFEKQIVKGDAEFTLSNSKESIKVLLNDREQRHKKAGKI